MQRNSFQRPRKTNKKMQLRYCIQSAESDKVDECTKLTIVFNHIVLYDKANGRIR